MYAIVDIETTGGHASSNGITEIAIIIHDGVTEVSRFETLVNPEKPIPIYVRALNIGAFFNLFIQLSAR